MRNYNVALWRRQILLIVALCVAASWPALAQVPTAQGMQSPVSSTDSVSLANHTSPQVLDGTATLVSHYNPEQMLRLVLAVQVPHMAEEQEFIQELVTKGSPNFHKFLTADEWNARFAPSPEDEQKVVDWVQSEGLTLTKRYPNRLLVDVEAPAGVIERAFGVTLNNYQVGDEVDFSNDRDPVLPASLSGIVHAVLGLNSIQRFHGSLAGKSKQKGPDYVPGPVSAEGPSASAAGDPTRAPANRAARVATNITPMSNSVPPLRNIAGQAAASPDNITNSEAYDFDGLAALSHCCNVHNDSGGAPAVSSIALVTFGNFEYSDVETFFAYYGMAYNFTPYFIDGSGPNQDDESPLEVEYSTAMANSYGSPLDTARVYVYENSNNLLSTYADAFNTIVTDDHARVVSTSYGWEEGVGFPAASATGTMFPIFSNMTGLGWTLIADAGDNGSTDGCKDAIVVHYPASDPNFIAAGGTQLLLNSSGDYVSETAWVGGTYTNACAINDGGGGGGLSTLFHAPAWQLSLGLTGRALPDISLNANADLMGQWYFYNGEWLDVGGTSIVAPELAGFFAQENTYLNYIGPICGPDGNSDCGPLGLAAPWLYDAAYGALRNPFYDMTSGCTSNDITDLYHLVAWCAGPGFDLATGLGSANMMQLAWGINWELIPAFGQPSVAFSGPAINTWYNTNQQVDWTASDSGGNYPSTGVAGFTQGWDSIPADPYSEPHGGSGNSFYTGPQFPFATLGCLSFVANSCSGGVSQGCHTVNVEAWDNQGRTVTSTYGPLCYDTVAPVATASATGTLVGPNYENLALVSLSATDSGFPSTGSGVANIYFQANGGPVLQYSVNFLLGKNGSNTVTYYATDVAGNIESTKTLTFGITNTTTTALASSLNPSGSGKAVKFTATVTPTSGTATGSVTFKDGATVLGTASISGGVATFSTSTLAVGSHSITASFLGSTYFVASASSALTQVVESGTTTVISSSANPSEYGQTVTLTATISHGALIPTGTVTFKGGTAVLATVAVGSAGTAAYATSTFTVATHPITAVYSGDSNYAGSTSAALSQKVEKAATSTSVVSSLNPSVVGEKITLTATVIAVAPGAGTPAGTVHFMDGSTLLGSHPLVGGVASLPDAKLAAGTHSITAVYVGNASFATSTSEVLLQTVNP